MTQLPEPVIDAAVLAEWFNKKAELARLKTLEMLLRTRIFRHFFPAPKEGTNTHVLEDQYQLKAVYSLTRKIQEEVMQALCARPQVGVNELGQPVYGKSKLEEAGVSPTSIIKWKPELSITAYRELTEEQRHLVDQMLLIEPGSPQLTITPPAKRRGKVGEKVTNPELDGEIPPEKG